MKWLDFLFPPRVELTLSATQVVFARLSSRWQKPRPKEDVTHVLALSPSMDERQTLRSELVYLVEKYQLNRYLTVLKLPAERVVTGSLTFPAGLSDEMVLADIQRGLQRRTGNRAADWAVTFHRQAAPATHEVQVVYQAVERGYLSDLLALVESVGLRVTAISPAVEKPQTYARTCSRRTRGVGTAMMLAAGVSAFAFHVYAVREESHLQASIAELEQDGQQIEQAKSTWSQSAWESDWQQHEKDKQWMMALGAWEEATVCLTRITRREARMKITGQARSMSDLMSFVNTSPFIQSFGQARLEKLTRLPNGGITFVFATGETG